LSLGSNCIDTGDPNDPLDTNGNYIDIGAFEFYDTTSVNSVINEVCYFRIYPNPAHEKFIIEGKDIERVDIYDISGKFVNSNYYTDKNYVLLDVHQLKSGIYAAHIKSKSGYNIQKLIIK